MHALREVHKSSSLISECFVQKLLHFVSFKGSLGVNYHCCGSILQFYVVLNMKGGFLLAVYELSGYNW